MFLEFHVYTCVSFSFQRSSLVKSFSSLIVILPSLGDGHEVANIISLFHGPHWEVDVRVNYSTEARLGFFWFFGSFF